MTSSRSLSGMTPTEKRVLLERLLKERAAGRSPSGYRLSYNERALWFLHELAPEDTSYNISLALRIRSAVDPDAFVRCLEALVSRHAMLRARYVSGDRGPERRLSEGIGPAFRREDVSGLDEDTLSRRVEEAHRRPFDLEAGPLFRVNLFSRATDDHVLLVSLHHIIADGWSCWLILEELRQLYAAEVAGVPARLPPPAASYADFTDWQARMLEGPAGKRLEAYWSGQLEGELPVLDLPPPRLPVPEGGGRGGTRRFRIDEALAADIRRLAASRDTTAFAVLLAGYQALLHRYTRQEDILVGVPTFGRSRGQFEGTVGLFMNPVVARAAVRGELPFAGLLTRAREATVHALEHQDYPFHLMAERFWTRRDLRTHPLFQAEFIFQKPQQSRGLVDVLSSGDPEARADFGGLLVENHPLSQQEGQVGLTLEMVDAPGAIPAAFRYDRTVVDDDLVAQMCRSLEAILHRVVESPDTPVSRLPVMDDENRRRVLTEWSGSGVVGAAPDRRVHESIMEAAERAPEALALVWEDGSLSYGDLRERVLGVAGELRARGVGPDVPVGVCLPRSPELIVAVLGVLQAGGGYLPLDPKHPPARLQAVLADAGAPVVVTLPTLGATLETASAELLCLDTLADAALDATAPSGGPDSLAYVIYTSGSTGGPKGVMIEHRSLAAYASAAAREFAVGPDDRVLQFAAITFDTSAEEIFPTLSRGATLVLRTEAMGASVEELCARVREWGVTVLDLPTAFWHEVVAAMAAGVVDLPDCVRLVIVGGERALPGRIEEWARLAPPGVRLVNTYGPTETTIVATWGDLVRSGAPRLDGSIGAPVPGCRAYVLDPHGNPVPPGVVGELHVGGVGLARGYLGRPDLTAESFLPDPFDEESGARLYRTGDLVRHLPDGSLAFVGRVGHQVKVRGFRVELEEIERLLRGHPAIREAVVTAPADASGVRSLVGYVVPAAGTTPPSSELRRFLANDLPDYMVPSVYVSLSQLPLTSSGKIDRRALPAPPEPASAGAEPAGPRDPVEEILCEVWKDVLAVAAVGVHDDFFELGGDSIKSIQVITRAARSGIRISAEQMFRHRTVAELAQATRATTGEEAEPIPSLSVSERRALSSIQRRLWYFSRLEPNSAAYNIPFSLKLEGQLDVDALSRGLRAVVDRHEALRTRFGEEDGEPVSAVVPPLDIPLPVSDLRGMSAQDREPEAQRLLRSLAEEPFDLAQAPLLRARLIRIDEKRSLLGLSVHHLAADGWSVGVLVDDLLRAYEAFSEDREPELDPLPVQYGDYAAWERRWQGSEAADRQLAYWRERLAGALPVVDLPRDHPRPAVQTFRGGLSSRWISEDLTRAVDELSRAHGATPFMTLLTVFGLLVHRLTGLEDLPIGVPVAGRNREETERLVGVFINTVVVRHDVTGDPTFAELLDRTRTLALEAYRNAELSFERVVEALHPHRDPGRTPLFQILFNSLDFSGRRRLDLSRLAVEVSGAAGAESKFDLTLYAGRDREETVLALSYNADLFRPERMEAFLEQFESILAQVVSRPGQRVSEVSLVTESARSVLPDPRSPLERWTGPSVVHAIEARAPASASTVAVSDPRGTLDYAALDRLTRGLARRLREAGVCRGDLVGLYGGRSAELVWGMLGILRAGAAFVVVDPAHPPARIMDILRAAPPRAWLESPHLDPLDGEIGRLLEASNLALRTPLDPSSAESGDEPSRPAGQDPEPEETAYVAFTSGTTGGVKGIVGTHGPLAHFVSWQVRTFGLEPTDRFSMLSGLSHDPLLRDVLTPLQLGASLCIPDPNDLLAPGRLRAWMAQEGVTVAHLTPSLATVITEGAEGGELPRLRLAFFGGDVLTTDVVARFRGVAPSATLVNFYGATETPQAMGCHVVTEGGGDEWERPSAQIPVGRGIDDVQLLVLDRAGGLAGVGELGEIVVRTPHLARGYLNDESLTRERFTTNPFTESSEDRLYRTGDLGRFRPDGLLDFAGRRDDQVKIRGYRVELEAVERVLRQHPSLDHAAVVAARNGFGSGGDSDAQLVAYVAHAAGHQLTVTELRRFLRTQLPDYMVPSSFVTLDSLPLTASGKVDRRRLLETARGSVTTDEASLPPRTDAEQLVAEIWREALGVDAVGVRDNFFDLGGHSLLAVRVLARIEERTGRAIDPRDMIYQTLEQFASGLEGSLPGERGRAASSGGAMGRLVRLMRGLVPSSGAPAR